MIRNRMRLFLIKNTCNFNFKMSVPGIKYQVNKFSNCYKLRKIDCYLYYKIAKWNS